MADPADGQTDGPVDEHPLVGHVIGDRYRIDALLGEGGMGAVFRATHLGLGRPVAVKVLHPRLTADEHIAKRFDREALAVSKLDHPNCVQVIDFGTTPKGMKYLVMQFLEGKELRDVTGVSLPIEQVVYLGIQVLRALEHAHKRGLVHRDLKPENIFLTQDDDGNEVIKLVDFGIVKLLEDTPQEKLTRMGMAFGTPTYMSPEQAAGGKIDPRTDLYSVGVVLYELLTGAPPFDADEPGILLRMHILADPPPLPDTVPRAVATVVGRLLAKEPHERYADAREARRALAAAYKLPSKITGVVGLAAVAMVDSADSADSIHGAAVVAGASHDVATDPPPSPSPAQAQLRAPTAEEAAAATRAEPVLPPVAAEPAPELFARSGGTVLAPPSHGSVPTGMPSAAASSSHGGTPVVHAAMPMPMPIPGPAASMSHGAMQGPAASMSHGSVPIVPPGPPRFDPLGMSSPGLPVMGPGAYASGAHPHAGYGPMPHRPSGRRSGIMVVVVALFVVTWIIIGAMWLSSRDDAGEAAPTAPAGAGPGGLYRFADDPAASGTPTSAGPAGQPTPSGTTPSGTTPSGTTRETKGKGETEGKGKDKDKDKGKKPKRDEDD